MKFLLSLCLLCLSYFSIAGGCGGINSIRNNAGVEIQNGDSILLNDKVDLYFYTSTRDQGHNCFNTTILSNTEEELATFGINKHDTFSIETPGTYIITSVDSWNVDYDTLIIYQELVSARSNEIKHQISLGPNPIDQTLFIHFEDESKRNLASLAIYDLRGTKIYEGPASTSINLSHLNKGAYLVVINDQNQIFKESIIVL